MGFLHRSREKVESKRLKFLTRKQKLGVNQEVECEIQL